MQLSVPQPVVPQRSTEFQRQGVVPQHGKVGGGRSQDRRAERGMDHRTLQVLEERWTCGLRFTVEEVANMEHRADLLRDDGSGNDAELYGFRRRIATLGYQAVAAVMVAWLPTMLSMAVGMAPT